MVKEPRTRNEILITGSRIWAVATCVSSLYFPFVRRGWLLMRGIACDEHYVPVTRQQQGLTQLQAHVILTFYSLSIFCSFKSRANNRTCPGDRCTIKHKVHRVWGPWLSSTSATRGDTQDGQYIWKKWARKRGRLILPYWWRTDQLGKNTSIMLYLFIYLFYYTWNRCTMS